MRIQWGDPKINFNKFNGRKSQQTVRILTIGLLLLYTSCAVNLVQPVAEPRNANKMYQELLNLAERSEQLDQEATQFFTGNGHLRPLEVLLPEHRDRVLEIWEAQLRLLRDLQLFKKKHSYHSDLSNPDLQLFQACEILQYSSGLHFLQYTVNRDYYEVLLDEHHPAHQISTGQYSRFKKQLLQPLRWLELINTQPDCPISDQPAATTATDRLPVQLQNKLNAKYLQLETLVHEEGIHLMIQNSLDAFKDLLSTTFYPFQKHLSLWASETRLTSRHDGYINNSQQKRLITLAQPGDILLERKEWYLSNLGLPGFWPHSALYLGSPEELAEWAADPDIEHFYHIQDPQHKGFVNRLATHYPDAFAAYLAGEAGEPNRILEGLKAGIVFHSATNSVGISDHVACLRPRLQKTDIAQAIEAAFAYWSRDYDFHFNFYSENELVCSELIYKSYAAGPGKGGLLFELMPIFTVPTMPANLIARQFDRDYDSNAQLELVIFYRGDIQSGTAEECDVNSFRQSHRWPRWYFSTDTIKKTD